MDGDRSAVSVEGRRRRVLVLGISARKARLLPPVSERRFQALIEHSCDATILMAGDGTITSASPATARVLGYAPEELVGRSVFDRMHRDDLPHTTEWFAQLLQQPGASATREFRYRHTDGTWQWMEGVGTNLLSEPSVQAIVANFRNITERKQAVEALHASEKRFRALVERSWDSTMLIAPDGTMPYNNPKTSVWILGYAPGELVGQNAFDWIHPDDRQGVMALFGQLLQQPGASLTAELRGRHKDGSWRWLEGTGTNLLSEPYVQAIVVNYRDITERKEFGEGTAEKRGALSPHRRDGERRDLVHRQ